MSVLQCISPIDGTVFATRETQHFEQAETACQKARIAQKEWAARPLEARISLVLKGVAALGAMNEAIVPELAQMMGRPIRYGGEFGGVNERAQYMAQIAPEALASHIVEASDAFERHIAYEPHGLVFVISPWNYPYMTAINTIVPALIAGNAVLLKGATQTLLVGERVAAAFYGAGLPEALFQNLFLDHDTSSALIAAGHFGFVNFTGSVSGGRAIEHAAAGTFTATGLELGGKDPGYVMEDANLDLAVETLVDGALFNSGQCCCGIERIYVAAPLYDDFVEKAKIVVEQHILGNPLDPETTLGPMAQRRFADEIRAQIAQAQSAGAKLVIDSAGFADDGGAYLAPQILTNVTHEMRIMREESFGPVIGVMKVSDDAIATSLMNDSAYGLTASLWTQDAERAARIGAQIETGTVFMNRCDYLDPALCWTGRKDTGRGAALSKLGYASVTRPKSYHLRKKL